VVRGASSVFGWRHTVESDPHPTLFVFNHVLLSRHHRARRLDRGSFIAKSSLELARFFEASFARLAAYLFFFSSCPSPPQRNSTSCRAALRPVTTSSVPEGTSNDGTAPAVHIIAFRGPITLIDGGAGSASRRSRSPIHAQLHAMCPQLFLAFFAWYCDNGDGRLHALGSCSGLVSSREGRFHPVVTIATFGSDKALAETLRRAFARRRVATLLCPGGL